MLHCSPLHCILLEMGKAGKLSSKAGGLRVKKKQTKKEKAMSSGALSDQIALKQYQDTIHGITSALDKRRELAPRVLHMLTSGMLDQLSKNDDEDRLPGCVNKFRILSLDNLHYLVQTIKDKVEIPEAMVNNFMRIKTKTEASRVFCYMVRAAEGSALPHRFLSQLADWSAERAKLNIHNIQKLKFVANGKNGRHAGVTADFNQHGVFSFCQFNETTKKYLAVCHNFSGLQSQFQELSVAEDWKIEFNHCEFLAQAKGKGSYDLITEFSNPEYKDNKEAKEFLISLPFNQPVIPTAATREQQQQLVLVSMPGSSTDKPQRKRLARKGSAASSAPDGDGNA